MKKFESRIFTGAQLRADGSQGDEMALVGYAACYNTLSHDLGGFREQIKPGAFDRALREQQDVRALFNHDSSKILGRVSANTLQLSSDPHGLYFRCQLDPNQQWHRDLYSSVKRGDASECSFAFTVHGGGETWDNATDERGQRFTRRTLTDVDLLDCSVVASPAYPGTAVSARHASSDSVRNAIATLDHEAWKRVMLRRAAGISKQIAEDAIAETVRQATKTGFKQVRIGPGEADVRFEAMTEAEYAQHIQNRAAQLGDEIRRERILSEHEEPTVTWDSRRRIFVPTIEKLLEEI